MKIEYLSALPGSGKTTWILKHMKENHDAKRSIIVYSAPTKLLLEQVQADLWKRYRIDAELIVSERGDANLIEHKIDDHIYNCHPGDVLLISHEALLRMTKGWRKAKEIELIVDEQISLIRDITRFQPQIKLDIWDRVFVPIKEGVFSEIKIREGCYDEMLAVKKRVALTSEIADNLSIKFLSWVMDPKYEVFVKCKRLTHIPYMRISSVSVVSTSVFTSVKRVILVGAFLESTEMFHVLKRDNHKMVPLKEATGLRDMSHRFSKLFIFPLFARKQMISKNARSLLVCPAEYHDYIKKRYYKNGSFDREAMQRDALAASKTRKKQNDIRKITGRPLLPKSDWDVYLEERSSVTVLDYFLRVWKTHPLFGMDGGQETLLAANKDELDRQRTSLPVHMISKLLSPKSHGLNCYTSYTRIAYFATMLPNPSRGQFYRDVLGDYSAKEWTINALAQSVTRTAVRNPDSDVSVTVLVPDMECALELKAKFDNLPRIKKLDIFGEMRILEKTLSRTYDRTMSEEDRARMRNASYYERNREAILAKRREKYREKSKSKTVK